MERQPPTAPLILGGLFGALAGVLTIAAIVGSIPFPGDLATAERIQQPGRLGWLAEVVNFAGTAWQWLVVLAAVVVVAVVKRQPAARVGALAALGALVALRPLSTLLKAIVEEPRPGADSGLRLEEIRSDYGFPSGHVYGDVLIYGIIAALAPRFLAPMAARAVQICAAVIIVLAGPARVYTGAHWPSDVLGGYLWGAAALCMAIVIGRLAAAHPRLSTAGDVIRARPPGPSRTTPPTA